MLLHIVHHAPVSLYVDGVFQETNTNMNIEFYGLVVGLIEAEMQEY